MKKTVAQDQLPATKSDVKEIVTEAFTGLAGIMERCFDDVYARLDKKADQQSIYELQADVSDIKGSMRKVESRLDKVEGKLDVVVSMYQGHERRIMRLEKAL